jgi:hypothetical protein
VKTSPFFLLKKSQSVKSVTKDHQKTGGGSRKGVPNKDRQKFIDAFNKVAKKRKSSEEEIIQAMWDLAVGLKFNDESAGTTYTTKPDAVAGKFILEQLHGKAPQTLNLENDDEKPFWLIVDTKPSDVKQPK